LEAGTVNEKGATDCRAVAPFLEEVIVEYRLASKLYHAKSGFIPNFWPRAQSSS